MPAWWPPEGACDWGGSAPCTPCLVLGMLGPYTQQRPQPRGLGAGCGVALHQQAGHSTRQGLRLPCCLPHAHTCTRLPAGRPTPTGSASHAACRPRTRACACLQVALHQQAQPPMLPATRTYVHAPACRSPYTNGLNLSAINTETDRRGFIPVSEKMEVRASGMDGHGMDGRGMDGRGNPRQQGRPHGLGILCLVTDRSGLLSARAPVGQTCLGSTPVGTRCAPPVSRRGCAVRSAMQWVHAPHGETERISLQSLGAFFLVQSKGYLPSMRPLTLGLSLWKANLLPQAVTEKRSHCKVAAPPSPSS